MPETKDKKTTTKKKTVAKKRTAVKSVKKTTIKKVSSKKKTATKKTTRRPTVKKPTSKTNSSRSTNQFDETFTKEYPIMGASSIERSTTPIERSASMQKRQFKKTTSWHKRTYHPLGEHDHLPHHHSYSALIILALVAASAFLYFGLRPGFDFNIPEVRMQKEYKSDNYNFSLQHPTKWRVSEFVVGSGEDRLESVVLQNGSQSIVIYTTREADDETLIPGSNYQDEVGGQKVVRYRDYDSDTGLLLERVVIERPDGLIHELRGYGPLFERVVDSFLLE